MTCLDCGAGFSGEYNELCSPCQRRLRLGNYVDPRGLQVWKRSVLADVRVKVGLVPELTP